MIFKKSVKNGLSKSRNLSEGKKPPRAQIFRYFRYKIRNNKMQLDVKMSSCISKFDPIFEKKVLPTIWHKLFQNLGCCEKLYRDKLVKKVQKISEIFFCGNS